MSEFITGVWGSGGLELWYIQKAEENLRHHQYVGTARRFAQDVEAVEPGGENGNDGQEPGNGFLNRCGVYLWNVYRDDLPTHLNLLVVVVEVEQVEAPDVEKSDGVGANIEEVGDEEPEAHAANPILELECSLH